MCRIFVKLHGRLWILALRCCSFEAHRAGEAMLWLLFKILLSIQHYGNIISNLLIVIHELLSLDDSLIVMRNRTISSEYLRWRDFLLFHQFTCCTFVEEGLLAAWVIGCECILFVVYSFYTSSIGLPCWMILTQALVLWCRSMSWIAGACTQSWQRKWRLKWSSALELEFLVLIRVLLRNEHRIIHGLNKFGQLFSLEGFNLKHVRFSLWSPSNLNLEATLCLHEPFIHAFMVLRNPLLVQAWQVSIHFI